MHRTLLDPNVHLGAVCDRKRMQWQEKGVKELKEREKEK